MMSALPLSFAQLSKLWIRFLNNLLDGDWWQNLLDFHIFSCSVFQSRFFYIRWYWYIHWYFSHVHLHWCVHFNFVFMHLHWEQVIGHVHFTYWWNTSLARGSVVQIGSSLPSSFFHPYLTFTFSSGWMTPSSMISPSAETTARIQCATPN